MEPSCYERTLDLSARVESIYEDLNDMLGHTDLYAGHLRLGVHVIASRGALRLVLGLMDDMQSQLEPEGMALRPVPDMVPSITPSQSPLTS